MELRAESLLSVFRARIKHLFGVSISFWIIGKFVSFVQNLRARRLCHIAVRWRDRLFSTRKSSWETKNTIHNLIIEFSMSNATATSKCIHIFLRCLTYGYTVSLLHNTREESEHKKNGRTHSPKTKTKTEKNQLLWVFYLFLIIGSVYCIKWYARFNHEPTHCLSRSVSTSIRTFRDHSSCFFPPLFAILLLIYYTHIIIHSNKHRCHAINKRWWIVIACSVACLDKRKHLLIKCPKLLSPLCWI